MPPDIPRPEHVPGLVGPERAGESDDPAPAWDWPSKDSQWTLLKADVTKEGPPTNQGPTPRLAFSSSTAGGRMVGQQSGYLRHGERTALLGQDGGLAPTASLQSLPPN